MDPDLPPGMGGFFQGLLGDLLRLMRTDSPVQWDLAAQLAMTIASDGASEPNVEPVERIRLEELMRIAQMMVSDVTGIALGVSGRPLQVVTTGRADWARRSLADWRPVIEQIAASIAPMSPPQRGGTGEEAGGGAGGGAGSQGRDARGGAGRPSEGGGTHGPDVAGGERAAEDPARAAGSGSGAAASAADLGELAHLAEQLSDLDLGDLGDLGAAPGRPGHGEGGARSGGEAVGVGGGEQEPDFAALLGQWTTAVAPAMIAMQVGSVVGHLAQRALGQYELPLPRTNEHELLVVPANVAGFASDWSLPLDDVRLFLLTRDLVAHALLSRPPVRRRVEALLVEHARGIRPDPTVLGARLGEVGADFADLTRLLGDPTALGQALDTPESRRVRAELSAVEAAIAGYVEWASEVVAARSIGARGPVAEALRRRRVERGGEERSAEALFGLRLDQDQVDRGYAFITGVVQRAGEAQLAKLWLEEGGLPTPAELDAPGLWIERVNLPPDAGSPRGEAGDGGAPS